MRSLAVILLPMALGFGFEETYTDSVFPPRWWTVVNADSGTRCWQRLDLGSRTVPGCAYCGWESAYLRNFDWLITPQCSVLAGDSLSFWCRAQDSGHRESLEVWLSTTTPRIGDFGLVDAFGTSSTSHERRGYDLSQHAGGRVFVGFVYRSLNQYGLMLDDVIAPSIWLPVHDAGVGRVKAPGRFLRVGQTVRPSCWVHNQGQVGDWVRVSCEVLGMWREETGVSLAPGESSLVVFPEIAFWQPRSLELVFATLLGSDQRYWNDTAVVQVAVHGFQSRGGPDSCGYVWYDSDDPLGPEYNWQELYPGGLLLGWGDDSLARLSLAWPFPFYGQDYTELFACTNGWLAFGPPSPGNPADSNVAIPGRYNPNRLIAPFWDDLWVKGTEGGVWYQYFGDTLLVIEWWHVRRKGCDQCSLNFEVKLFRTGAIEFHYAGADAGDPEYDAGMSATVGIENSSGTVGLQYLYDGSPPGNLLCSGRAIRFQERPPGVEEGRTPYATSQTPTGTIVRGVLRIGDRIQETEYRAELLDVSGRRVMVLQPGENDVSHLAPGVYFVRPAGTVPIRAKVIVQH